MKHEALPSLSGINLQWLNSMFYRLHTPPAAGGGKSLQGRRREEIDGGAPDTLGVLPITMNHERRSKGRGKLEMKSTKNPSIKRKTQSKKQIQLENQGEDLRTTAGRRKGSEAAFMPSLKQAPPSLPLLPSPPSLSAPSLSPSNRQTRSHSTCQS
jgi:hypothetical protein